MSDSHFTRRQFIAGVGASAAALAFAPSIMAAQPVKNRTNVLFITADDMNFDSLGVTGCKIPGITASIDALARQGIRFDQAHVTSAICQPSRSALMTGRYPHRSGALGFDPIRTDVPTLVESLKKAGYLTGIMAKVAHLRPGGKFPWDLIVEAADLDDGRDPALYYKHSKAFFERSKAEGKPFFMMANSQDPHRPFPGSAQAGGRDLLKASRYYKPEEVEAPCFLPDLPDVRKEMAQYYTAVHRCDETVGQLLRALRETGMDASTLVVFLSDNGISEPFAKTNCYFTSTATPLIARWPGRIKPGSLNRADLVSGIDFMPTMIDALGLAPVKAMDGRSYLPLLEGKKQAGREKAFTFITSTSAKLHFPMRCVRTRTRSYIFNAWSDGKTVFKNEPQGGLAFKAMQAAAGRDPKIAEHVRFFLYRVPEEFYDLAKDPCELTNLIDSPQHADEIAKLRAAMLEMMRSTDDPLLEAFRRLQ